MNSVRAHKTISHTYPALDLKLHIDLGQIELVSLREKERRLAHGENYGRMLTPESLPGAYQQHCFEQVLNLHGARLANQILDLGLQLLAAHGSRLTLISLARAGIPVGVLLTRFLRSQGCDVSHHGISVIRGAGLDMVALQEIMQERGSQGIVFVDGWTGKGSIRNELNQSLLGHQVLPLLAVICDPAGIADFQATFKDQLLPHACLNASVSGLISRTFLQRHSGTRHAARFETDLIAADVSRTFVDHVQKLIPTTSLLTNTNTNIQTDEVRPINAAQQALELGAIYGVQNPHHIKPSLGEAWRTLLRRKPKALLLGPPHPEQNAITAFAEFKNVPIYRFTDTMPYQVIALLGDSGASQ